MEEKLDSFMAEIWELMRESQKEMEQMERKFSSLGAELKREVNAAQERMPQHLNKKIGCSSQQFQWKGNEYQFAFNSGIEDSISTANSKINTSNPDTKEALKKAEPCLEEGTESP